MPHRRLVGKGALGLLLFSATLSTATPGRADGNEDQRRHATHQRGFEAVRRHDWPTAYNIYSELWHERQTYDVAILLGQSELNLKKYRDAAEHLAFGLRYSPAREEPARLALVRGLLEQAKEHVGTLKLQVEPAKADVYVDDKPIGTTPLELDVFIEPGVHTVEAKLTGYDSVRETVEAASGRERTVELKLRLAAAAAVPPAAPATPSTDQDPSVRNPEQAREVESDSSSRSYVPAGIAAGTAGIALAGGIALFVLSTSKESDRKDRAADFSGDNPCFQNSSAACNQLHDDAKEARTFRNLSYVSLGVAATAGVITYLLWPHAKSEEKLDIGVAPAIGGSGWHAAVRGAF